ncbi:hypothetical protein DWU98_04515 [Dyella monticola]|uniref:SseB protein N-terminal domain-containing protein n=1 Tax=Dyella monticola TaxID=1927958 RepID=A0A370X5J1_9GAMM|nr:SseB family protein [Dyella monticola]RDS83602.1 hypothetical protein DWU98_04515 [Dyella monticola]
MTMTDASDDRLEALWRQAGRDVHAEEAFLRELSGQRVSVILRQRPGPGDAAPERNLVQWKRESDGTAFAPVFTHPTHVAFSLPAPAQLVLVPVRVLLAAGGDQTYIVNPLSEAPFELRAAQRTLLRRSIAETHHDAEWPSLHAPWIFRLPDDALYPVAVKLVEWFNATGHVDQAFLYELTRGKEPRTEIVLGLNEPADTALADALMAIVTQAGVEAASFIIRFLPDEPSHREGLAQAGLTPFYQRPAPSHHLRH